MVLNNLKLKLAEWRQRSLIFRTNEVIPCDMRINETFNNRFSIEIPVFDTRKKKGEEDRQPDAILRGVLCKSVMHNAPTVIFAMGQNQNAEEARHFIPESLFYLLNIVLVNYRGYGISNGTDKQKARGSDGIPSSQALENDIVRVYDYVKKTYKLTNFYGAGLSLGSSLITYLSKHRQLEGQLLITPFDCMLHQAHDVIVEAYGLTDLSLDDVKEILQHPFDSVQNMQENSTKTYVIRAGKDTFVKKKLTDNLLTHISNLRSDVTIEHAEHNFESDNPHIMSALRTAIGTALRNFMIDCTEKGRNP